LLARQVMKSSSAQDRLATRELIHHATQGGMGLHSDAALAKPMNFLTMPLKVAGVGL
jgi:hypothetical protein